MGRTLNNRDMTAKDLLRLTSPVILCASRPDFEKALAGNGYVAFSLNLPLAKRLSGLDVQDIRLRLTEMVHEILPSSGACRLTNYEMLFTPQYEIDVLRLFTDIARQRKLIIKWCGSADENTLTYAEQGYADYKRYNINDYDITVVK